MESWAPLSTFTDLPAPTENPAVPMPPALPPSGYLPGRLSLSAAFRGAWGAFSKQWPVCVLGSLIFLVASAVLQTPMQVAQMVIEATPWKAQEQQMMVLLIGGVIIIFAFFWAVTASVSILLTGGLMMFSLDAVRNPFREPKLGLLFSAFRSPVWYRLLVFASLWGLFVLVACLVAALPCYFLYRAFGMEVALAVGILILLVPSFYLAVPLNFGYLLVMDRGLGAWEAMRMAVVTVHGQWFRAFVLMLAMGLVAMLGILLCCVGLLATMPFSYLVWVEGYRQIFGDPGAEV